MIATLLQVVGLLLLAGGVYVWFGTGPGLIVLGLGVLAVGVAAEREAR